MATNVALAGIASLYVDGNPVLLVSGLTYQTNGYDRESAVGMDALHGFTQKVVPCFIAFKARLTSALPLSYWDNLTSSTVVANLVNGSVVSGYGMYITKAAEGDAAEATADIRFEGASVSVDG